MCDNRLGACSHGSNMVVFVRCVKGEVILKLGYLSARHHHIDDIYIYIWKCLASTAVLNSH